MEIKSSPVVAVKEKNKDVSLDVKTYLEILDTKIQKMREIKFCIHN